MKYVLEFGICGGWYQENMVAPTRALAERMACNLQSVFTGTSCDIRPWFFSKGGVRKMWSDGTHFIAISKLDGGARGPASAQLWGPEHHTGGKVVTTMRGSSLIEERA